MRKKYQADRWIFYFFNAAGDMNPLTTYSITKLFEMLAANPKWVAGERILAEIIRRYDAVLTIKIAYYIRDNAQLVEEVLLDVFMDIWRKRRQLDDVKSPDAWILTVCRNKAISAFRNKKNRALPSDGWPEDLLDYPDDHPLFDQVVYRDLLDRVRREVSQMPVQRRKIYMMNKFDDLSVAGIAALLKVDVRTVKSQVQRVQEVLRAKLGHLWKERSR